MVSLHSNRNPTKTAPKKDSNGLIYLQQAVTN